MGLGLGLELESEPGMELGMNRGLKIGEDW